MVTVMVIVTRFQFTCKLSKLGDRVVQKNYSFIHSFVHSFIVKFSLRWLE